MLLKLVVLKLIVLLISFVVYIFVLVKYPDILSELLIINTAESLSTHLMPLNAVKLRYEKKVCMLYFYTLFSFVSLLLIHSLLCYLPAVFIFTFTDIYVNVADDRMLKYFYTIPNILLSLSLISGNLLVSYYIYVIARLIFLKPGFVKPGFDKNFFIENLKLYPNNILGLIKGRTQCIIASIFNPCPLFFIFNKGIKTINELSETTNRIDENPKKLAIGVMGVGVILIPFYFYLGLAVFFTAFSFLAIDNAKKLIRYKKYKEYNVAITLPLISIAVLIVTFFISRNIMILLSSPGVYSFTQFLISSFLIKKYGNTI